MNRLYKKYDVGVIIARMQINKLHSEHIDLIETVTKEHKKVLIFLGIAPTFGDPDNSLPYEARYQMLLEKFPNIIIQPIEDNESDITWSKNLDNKIKSVLTPMQSVVLYGSRDSFLKHYCGKFETVELEATKKVSASEIRESISKEVVPDAQFRSGIIWLAYNQYPKIYPTVDIAVVNQATNEMLMGRKHGAKRFRFIGGFADPNNNSFEEDAARELREETGLTPGLDTFKYIGSINIDDWRYKKSVNKIRTTFFYTNYDFGIAKADDDIEEVKWFDINSITENDIVKEHIPLLKMFMKYIGKE